MTAPDDRIRARLPSAAGHSTALPGALVAPWPWISDLEGIAEPARESTQQRLRPGRRTSAPDAPAAAGPDPGGGLASASCTSTTGCRTSEGSTRGLALHEPRGGDTSGRTSTRATTKPGRFMYLVYGLLQRCALRAVGCLFDLQFGNVTEQFGEKTRPRSGSPHALAAVLAWAGVADTYLGRATTVGGS